MADRYWVGGTGNWDTTTTHWSATSGGAGGASVPTAADNVIFNSASGTNFTVTVATSSRTCLDFTAVSGVSMTFAGTSSLSISGSLSLPASGFTPTYTGTITFNVPSAKTITTNGVALASQLVFNGTGGSWALQTAVTTTGAVVLTAGTLDLNAKTLTAASFVSTGTTTRSIGSTGGTGYITTTGSGTNLNVTGSNISNTGVWGFKISYSGATATTVTNSALAITTYINSGTYVLSLTSGNVYNDLDFTGFNGSWAASSSIQNLYGNFILPASGGSYTGFAGVGNITFVRTSGTSTITTNGRTFPFGINVNGVGGTVQFADNFSQNISMSLILTNGTLDINSKTNTVGIFTIISGTHALTNGTLNCTSVTHTSGNLSIGTGYNITSAGAYTFTAGSITINDGVVLTIPSFVSTNTNTRSIAFGTGSIKTTSTGTVWNVTGASGLSYTGTPNVNIDNNTATALTITNTATETSAFNFNIINGTYALTLTSGNSYKNLNFTGFAGTWAAGTTTHTIYGDWTFPASGGTFSGTSGTATLTFARTSGTSIITTNGRTVNFTFALNGVGGTLQLADNLSQTSLQSFRLTNGTLDINSKTTSFYSLTINAVGTRALSNGTLNCSTVNHSTGDLSIGAGYTVVCSGVYIFSGGSITINDGITLSTGQFSSSGSTARSIAFGTGNITTTGSGTMWNTATSTGFSYTGTPTINISYTGSTASTIDPGPLATADLLDFNITTGTYSLTITNSANIRNLNFTGFDGTWACGTNVINVFGNFTLGNTTNFATSGTAGTLHVVMQASSGTSIITTNGKTVNFGIDINGTSTVTYQLADNITQGSTQTFALTVGILDLNNKTTSLGIFSIISGTHSFTNGTINCVATNQSGSISYTSTAGLNCSGTYTQTSGTLTLDTNTNINIFAYSDTGVVASRSFVFGTNSSITLTGYGAVWNLASSAAGLSVSGSSKIIVYNTTAISVSLNHQPTAASDTLNFYITTGNYNLSLVTGSSFSSFDFTGFTGTFDMGTSSIVLFGNFILSPAITTAGTTGTISFQNTANINCVSTINFNIEFNGSASTLTMLSNLTFSTSKKFTFIRGTVSLGVYILSAGILDITTTYSPSSKTFDFSSGGYVKLTGTSGTILTATGASFIGTSRIDISSTATTGTITVSIGDSSSATPYYNFNVNSGSYTLALAATNSSYSRINNIDFTGFSGSLGTSTNPFYITGNITIPTTITSISGTGLLTFPAGGVSTIISNGKTFTQPISIAGGNVTLGSAIITTSVSGITHDTGTFTTSNYNVTSNVYLITSGTKTINLGSSTLTLTAGGAVWNVTSASGLTLNSGTSTINMTSSSVKTFAGAGLTYYKLNQGGSGALIVSGSNTFNDITATVRPSTITLTVGTTQTVSNFSLQGTAGNLVTLNTTSAGSAATLSKSTGTVTARYLSIKDSTATGGATWLAPSNYGNVNVSGNTGWNFAVVIVSFGASNFFAFF